MKLRILSTAAVCAVLFAALGQDNVPRKIENAKVIFLGDSLTSNNGKLGPARGYYHWTDVVKERFHLDVVNLGKGGSRADGGLDRLKKALAEGRPPDFVLINFGMNDHKIAEKDARAVSSVAAFSGQLKSIVETVRAAGAQPILVTPHAIYEGEPGGKYYYGKYAAANFAAEGGALKRFDTFIEAIRTVAKEMNVPLIDIRKISEKYDGREYTLEGVHLAKLGHEIYGTAIGDFLAENY